MTLSCNYDLEILYKVIDTETEPDLTVENFETQRFDSARLQVRIISPLMKQFNSASEPRREFPNGLHVWIYEKTGELNAEITANWAIQTMETDLWEARNNVVVTNVDGRILETEQLFWDQKESVLYSERFTKITESNGSTASGDSFWALQDFSRYTLTNRSRVGRTIIYVREEEEEEEENDSDEENDPVEENES
jgi:LPS export ABC transporter protein LptC